MRIVAMVGVLFVTACASTPYQIGDKVYVEPGVRLEIESNEVASRRCDAASKAIHGATGGMAPIACAIARLEGVEGARQAGDVYLSPTDNCVVVAPDSQFWVNYELGFRCAAARNDRMPRALSRRL